VKIKKHNGNKNIKFSANLRQFRKRKAPARSEMKVLSEQEFQQILDDRDEAEETLETSIPAQDSSQIKIEDMFLNKLAALKILSKIKAQMVNSKDEDGNSNTLQEYGFWPNQIEIAASIVESIVNGKHTILLNVCMQGGKTGIAGATFVLLQDLWSRCATDAECQIEAAMVCANDQLDLRSQNREALEYHGIKVLSRKDRELLQTTSRPYLIIYDETQYGDGLTMTCDAFFTKHNLRDNKSVIFIGISATPFSAITATAFHKIMVSLDLLESQGYNSPRMMLEKKRVVESERLFASKRSNSINPRDIRIQTDSNIYRHIVHEIESPNPYGYGILRCRYVEGEVLKRHLKKRYGNRVYIVDYNQHNKEFHPATFFEQKRKGTFTIVLIQHKARMGVVIPTKYVKFLYEYVSSATIETTAQSLIGRACGFGKQNHKAIVYTSIAKVKAYSIFSEGRVEEFYRFADENGLRVSYRANVEAKEINSGLSEEKFHFPSSTSIEEIRREMGMYVRDNYDVKPVFRTLSATKLYYNSRDFDVWTPEVSLIAFSTRTAIGSVTVVILDDYHKDVGVKKTWEGTVVRVVRREGKKTVTSYTLEAKSSLFSRREFQATEADLH
jgi:hypothetical protein